MIFYTITGNGWYLFLSINNKCMNIFLVHVYVIVYNAKKIHSCIVVLFLLHVLMSGYGSCTIFYTVLITNGQF